MPVSLQCNFCGSQAPTMCDAGEYECDDGRAPPPTIRYCYNCGGDLLPASHAVPHHDDPPPLVDVLAEILLRTASRLTGDIDASAMAASKEIGTIDPTVSVLDVVKASLTALEKVRQRDATTLSLMNDMTGNREQCQNRSREDENEIDDDDGALLDAAQHDAYQHLQRTLLQQL